MGATCNCIPGVSGTMMSSASSFLNCQSYRLDQSSSAQHSVNATILASGQCTSERYDSYFLSGRGTCSELESALSGIKQDTQNKDSVSTN